MARLLCFYFPQLWVLQQKSLYFKKKLKIYAFIWILIWGNCQVLHFYLFGWFFGMPIVFNIGLYCYQISYLLFILILCGETLL